VPKTIKISIKSRITVPVTCAMFFLIGSGILGMLSLQRSHVDKEMEVHTQEASELFNVELRADAGLLSTHIDFIEKDEKLRNAWLSKDKDALLSLTEPLFKEIRSKNRITHFYFIGLDRVCFLRVHNPGRFGDKINRHTMIKAEKKQKEASGIELGPYGTFALRVVRPWRIDGKVVGYIELGEEITHVTKKLKNILSEDMYIIVNKKHLNKEKWSEGLGMVGLRGDWDQFEDSVVIDGTTEDLPKELQAHLRKIKLYDSQEHHAFQIKISSENRYLAGGFTPLLDARGNDVGDIIILTDVTEEESALRKLVIILLASGFFIGAALSLFLYRYVSILESNILKINQQLEVANLTLEGEVKKRTQELQEEKRSLEFKVKERTRELNTKIQDLKQINEVMVGREVRVIELKKDINKLCKELGKSEPYDNEVS